MEESYRLRQSRGKLERLEREYAELDERLENHYRITNGQPMNDKRNGVSWFKKENWLLDKIRDKRQEIEEQRERVEKLEEQAYNKANGLTRNGSGLEMSVPNLPRIKEHIKRAEQGELFVTKATVRRWKKKVIELEQMKEASDTKLTAGAQKLVDDGLLRQWKKKPTIYFVTDHHFRKLALELNSDGKFEECSVYKYRAKTEDAEKYIRDLLEIQEESK